MRQKGKATVSKRDELARVREMKLWLESTGFQWSAPDPDGFNHTTKCKMAERWKCVICSFLCILLTELLTHLNSVHRDDMSFIQRCGLPDCSSKTDYTVTNSFVKHVRTQHRALLFSTFEDVFGGKEKSLSGESEQSGEIVENKSGNIII